MKAVFARVFVYGTLLRGEGNHRLLMGAQFVAQARTQSEFTFHDLGGCPGMIRGTDCEHQTVLGELYDVDEEILAALDRLEGHPRFYRRTEILIDRAPVQTYLLPRDRFGHLPRIPSGSWLEHGKARYENHTARRQSI